MAGFKLKLRRTGSWDKASKRMHMAEINARRLRIRALKRVALKAERAIKVGIKSGAPGGQKFAPLAPMTRLLTRRRKPLARSFGTGLAGAITTRVDERAEQAFVGVLRTRRNRDGDDMFNIALAHEYGVKPYTIKVTEGIRRFFWALFFKTNGKIKPISEAKTEILHPGIPARPFIRPVIFAIHSDLQAELTGVAEMTFREVRR